MNYEILRKLDMGQPLKVFAFHPFRIQGLFAAFQVLQATSAAFSVKGAFRLRAIGTFFDDLHHPTPRKILLVLQKFNRTEFPGQGALHKAHATIGKARHSLAPLYQFFYSQIKNHQGKYSY
jgi:hypothetical protein